MAYAMADLGWKFYFINAAWDFVFLIIAYFTFVETKGLELEEINAKFEDETVLHGVTEYLSSREEELEVGKNDGLIEKSQEV